MCTAVLYHTAPQSPALLSSSLLSSTALCAVQITGVQRAGCCVWCHYHQPPSQSRQLVPSITPSYPPHHTHTLSQTKADIIPEIALPVTMLLTPCTHYRHNTNLSPTHIHTNRSLYPPHTFTHTDLSVSHTHTPHTQMSVPTLCERRYEGACSGAERLLYHTGCGCCGGWEQRDTVIGRRGLG
jgi:hypothetical protein